MSVSYASCVMHVPCLIISVSAAKTALPDTSLVEDARSNTVMISRITSKDQMEHMRVHNEGILITVAVMSRGRYKLDVRT